MPQSIERNQFVLLAYFGATRIRFPVSILATNSAAFLAPEQAITMKGSMHCVEAARFTWSEQLTFIRSDHNVRLHCICTLVSSVENT